MTPDDYTIKETFLEVGDGHTLYVHDWGNKAAKTPIIFLHGGPGNGCDNADKQKFEPRTQRVIFFDQRGAGKSLPEGSIAHNTANDLIEDIEKIVNQLQLTRFILLGSSWGTTLALTYAIAHPDKVIGILIDGVFLASQSELDWLVKGQWRQFFPEIWDEYIASVPAEHRNNPSQFHYQHALGNDERKAKRSIYEYIKMELSILKLDELYAIDEFDKFNPGGGRIEIHYLANSCFLPDDYILSNADKITMPVKIIQGRFDMVCPPSAAYALHKALPNSAIVWTINGHLRQHEAKNIQALFLKQLTEAV